MNSYLVISSAFLLGFSGGFGHCVAMCHPFVLYISTKYSYTAQGFNFLIPQIKYNLGRITTYSLLGALVGGFGSLAGITKYIMPAQKIILIIAGMLLIIYASWTVSGKHFPIPKMFGSILKLLPFLVSPYLTGLILGFLPCGLLFGALITSAASTNILTGTLSMALFGVGTSAALLLLSLFGGTALKYISTARWIFTAILFFTGIYFVYKGVMLTLT